MSTVALTAADFACRVQEHGDPIGIVLEHDPAADPREVEAAVSALVRAGLDRARLEVRPRAEPRRAPASPRPSEVELSPGDQGAPRCG